MLSLSLTNNPRLILADEPTGNLDSKTAGMIYEVLREIALERTVIVVTHAESLVVIADRVLHMKDGRFE